MKLCIVTFGDIISDKGDAYVNEESLIEQIREFNNLEFVKDNKSYNVILLDESNLKLIWENCLNYDLVLVFGDDASKIFYEYWNKKNDKKRIKWISLLASYHFDEKDTNKIPKFWFSSRYEMSIFLNYTLAELLNSENKSLICDITKAKDDKTRYSENHNTLFRNVFRDKYSIIEEGEASAYDLSFISGLGDDAHKELITKSTSKTIFTNQAIDNITFLPEVSKGKEIFYVDAERKGSDNSKLQVLLLQTCFSLLNKIPTKDVTKELCKIRYESTDKFATGIGFDNEGYLSLPLVLKKHKGNNGETFYEPAICDEKNSFEVAAFIGKANEEIIKLKNHVKENPSLLSERITQISKLFKEYYDLCFIDFILPILKINDENPNKLPFELLKSIQSKSNNKDLPIQINLHEEDSIDNETNHFVFQTGEKNSNLFHPFAFIKNIKEFQNHHNLSTSLNLNPDKVGLNSNIKTNKTEDIVILHSLKNIKDNNEELKYIYIVSSRDVNYQNDSFIVFYSKSKYRYPDMQIAKFICSQIFSIFYDEVARIEIKNASQKSAIAAIMSRQMSHNLGSHVIPGTRYEIKKNFLKKDIDGIDRLLQYLQERMDFISMIVNTSEEEKLYGSLNLKAHILDELAMDGPAIRHNNAKNPDQSRQNETATTNFILRHIIKSENFYRFESLTSPEIDKNKNDDIFSDDKENKAVEIQIIQLQKEKNEFAYKKFTSVSNGDNPSSPFSKTDFAVPYGVNGRHAFLNILEDFIRNSAKHNKEELKDLKSLIFTILVQTKKDLGSVIPSDQILSNSQILDKIGDDEYLITIFSNKKSHLNELADIKHAFSKLKLLNDTGSVNQENKGLKEILICLAWLKNKMKDLSIIENQVNGNDFIELGLENSLCNFALVKNPIKNDVDHLALRFTLKKYRFAYIITQKEFDSFFETDYKLNYSDIFQLPSAEIYLLHPEISKSDDYKEKVSQLKKSIPKLLELDYVLKNINEGQVKKELNELLHKNEDDYIKKINSTEIPFNIEIQTEIMKAYIMQTHNLTENEFPKLYIVREGQNPEKSNKYAGENEGLVIRQAKDDFTNINLDISRNKKVLLFRNHNDEPGQFKTAYDGLKGKIPAFMEGISGNNFTYNLVISNVITELEYYKIVDSSLTKIAIIDERIFDHYVKTKNNSAKKNDSNKNKFIQDVKDNKKNQEILDFLNKYLTENMKPEKTMTDIINIKKLKDDDAKLNKIGSEIFNEVSHDIYSGKGIYIYDLGLPDNKNIDKSLYDKVFNSSLQQCIDFDQFSYISIHFGLVEKYKPTVYTGIIKRFENFKKEVLKLSEDSTTKISIHSGRGNLTNLEDQVRFLPVSSIESQMTNCKHLLIQQFSNLKYRI